MFDQLGGILEAVCRTGRNEAVLVAPFIKRAVLERLLSALPASVDLLCVTRWRPEEIAAGVSDPDIWLDIQVRERATLRLCSSLHAKYYRIDDACFIGSANLTATALGWSTTPNLEILYPFGGSTTEWKTFEHRLTVLSVPCKEVVYQQMKETAALLKSELNANVFIHEETTVQPIDKIRPRQIADEIVPKPLDLRTWLPQLREPADLYFAYSKRAECLTLAARTTAIADLANLQIPLGLSEPIFRRFVALQLLQVPCIAAVDAFVAQSQRFGAVRAYLTSLPCSMSPQFDATRAWQVLMRWLLYFLPDRYEHSVPNHSEIFKIKQ